MEQDLEGLEDEEEMDRIQEAAQDMVRYPNEQFRIAANRVEDYVTNSEDAEYIKWALLKNEILHIIWIMYSRDNDEAVVVALMGEPVLDKSRYGVQLFQAVKMIFQGQEEHINQVCHDFPDLPFEVYDTIRDKVKKTPPQNIHLA